MKLGVLGGTGRQGTGLGLRLAKAGFSVAIGSRSAEKGRKKARELSEQLEGSRLTGSESSRLTGGENGVVVASAQMVFLTAPFPAAASLLRSHREAFREGTVLVDVTVPLVFSAGSVELLQLEEGSGSEHLAKYLPERIPLVAAFKTISASVLANLKVSLDCDVFVCGDWQEAKKRVMEVAACMGSLRAIDAGALRQAQALERMAVLAIEINRSHGIGSSRYRVVGLPGKTGQGRSPDDA